MDLILALSYSVMGVWFAFWSFQVVGDGATASGWDSSLFVVLRCCFGTLCSGECGRYFRERLASHIPENFGR